MLCGPQWTRYIRQKPGTSFIPALVYQDEHGRTHMHTKSKAVKSLPQSLRRQEGCVSLLSSPHH